MRRETLQEGLVATYEAVIGGVENFKVKPWEIQIGDVLCLRDIEELKVIFHSGKQFIYKSNLDVLEDYINEFTLEVDENVMSRIDKHMAKIGECHSESVSLALLQKLTDEIREKRRTHFEELKTYSIRSHAKDLAIIEEMKSKVDRKRLQQLLSISASEYSRKHFVKDDIVDTYLNLWANAKYEFYVMFGNQLTIEKEFEYEMSTSEMESAIKDLSLRYPKYAFWLDKFEAYEYINNKIRYVSSKIETIVDYCKSGMKLSGFFSRLFQDNEFDIELSKVLQNKSIKGYLTISIDPYDYLTSSINKHDWRSCHRITDGEYGTGSLSYLLDDTTMIAYKHNGNTYDYSFYGFKFNGNSKAFRQCVYFDKDSCNIIFGRNYPNSNADVCSNIRELLQKQVQQHFDLPDETIWVRRSNDYEGSSYTDISELHYSDIENDYNFVFCRLKDSPTDIGEFRVGYDVPCLICGDPVIYEGDCGLCGDCIDEYEED